jgi:Ca2+/Na+ antiporter
MHWLFLFLAFAAMALAFLTTSMAMLAVCLLAALALFVLWVLGLYQTRVAGSDRDATLMLDPAELRRLREQTQARRQENDDTGDAP